MKELIYKIRNYLQENNAQFGVCVKSIQRSLIIHSVFYKNTRLEIAQNLKTFHEPTEAEERRIQYKILKIVCFSANGHQCNIAFSVVRATLLSEFVLLFLIFLFCFLFCLTE